MLFANPIGLGTSVSAMTAFTKHSNLHACHVNSSASLASVMLLHAHNAAVTGKCLLIVIALMAFTTIIRMIYAKGVLNIAKHVTITVALLALGIGF